MALATSPGRDNGKSQTGSIYPLHIRIIRGLLVTLLLPILSLSVSYEALACPFAEDETPAAAQVIEAVNALRIDQGLNSLNVHSALMQAAQIEAEGIANGMPGHWRPNGLTLGQWLISLGYPLAGDLTQDGYRSENWLMARSVKEAIQAWKGDGVHSNTMLSPDRSDIGVGIVLSDDVYIIVLITALQTASGKMQSAASPLLTQAASSNSGSTDGFLLSQYMKPVALNTARPDGDVIHKVQYGQSLWSIAMAYHTTIEDIRAWNNLWEATTVYEGQVLLVQKSATQPLPTIPATKEATAPLKTVFPRRATPSATATALQATTSSDKNLPSPSFSIENLSGLILIVFALGGLILIFVRQRKR